MKISIIKNKSQAIELTSVHIEFDSGGGRGGGGARVGGGVKGWCSGYAYHYQIGACEVNTHASTIQLSCSIQVHCHVRLFISIIRQLSTINTLFCYLIIT